LIFSDVVMPGKDGLSLLEDLKSAGRHHARGYDVGPGSYRDAVRATRLGALDFSGEAGFPPRSCCSRWKTCSDCGDWSRRICNSANVWESTKSFGTGETMRKIMAQVERVAASRNARLHPRRDRHGKRTDRANICMNAVRGFPARLSP